ncbi:hypothetical protein E9531_13575 [Lampropedia puyangensis]|uniref:DUF2946 domain-containing protein n=1 Tax=Lampropedia puyangensis TaxID=1330072 RepID=A0A4S8F0T6_9BURK|nr:DUF2946 family protein [Lampropedia puyangensis]THT98711.1 hypothetical protein E9531_13575 [Lampropedia puyangensis]
MNTPNAVATQQLAQVRRWLVRGWRWRVSILLLLAIFLRALVPQGYMPAASSDQDVFFAMVVCTPDGPLDVSGKHSTSPTSTPHSTPDASESAHAKTVCSFSAMAWQILLDGLWLALLFVLLLLAIRILPPRYCAPIWAPRTDIRAARAPPFTV